MLTRIFAVVNSTYDKAFAESNVKRIEALVVLAAVTGFLLNLLAVYLDRNWPQLELLAEVNPSYLSAIYTPFSIILLFEILLLLLAIPQSLTRSVARQYEIISLIVIIEVFKQMAGLEGIADLGQQGNALAVIGWYTGTGIILFLLVGVFYLIRQRHVAREKLSPGDYYYLISLKRLVTLFLALFTVYIVASAILVNPSGPNLSVLLRLSIHSQVFADIFVVLIFVDVLLLIISYIYTEHYELVLRNACYVISVILIRFALTISAPNNLPLLIAAMLVGISASGIYYLYGKYKLTRPQIVEVG